MTEPKRRRRVTRDDVAAAAGVSPSVVSYVVNDGPRNVAAETRMRVLAAMDELGYAPNMNGRAVRVSLTQTIGVVLPNIDNPFFAELAGQLEQVAYENGLALLIGNSNEEPEREERYIRSFVERQVDGILLVTVGGRPLLTSVQATQTPVALLDRPQSAEDRIPFVGIDNEAAARAITEHLIRHGHSRIACVAGPQDQQVSQARQAGWRQALEGAGLPFDPSLLEYADFSIESSFQLP